jgi:hypothetical protein
VALDNHAQVPEACLPSAASATELAILPRSSYQKIL